MKRRWERPFAAPGISCLGFSFPKIQWCSHAPHQTNRRHSSHCTKSLTVVARALRVQRTGLDEETRPKRTGASRTSHLDERTQEKRNSLSGAPRAAPFLPAPRLERAQARTGYPKVPRGLGPRPALAARDDVPGSPPGKRVGGRAERN